MQDSIRHAIGDTFRTQHSQSTYRNSRAGGAIGVEITNDDDLRIAVNGLCQQLASAIKPTQRVRRKQAGQAVPEVKPILEVNAEHALVKKLEASTHFDDLANILFDQALLAEGGMPADPAAYVKRVNALLV